MSILTDLPFPFHKREGQELLRVMVALYRSQLDATMFAQKYGIDPADIPSGLSLRQLWYHFLLDGNAHNVTRDLVQGALDQFPRSEHAPFLRALLENTNPPPTSAEPADPAGGPPPGFTGNPVVTQPEALLFGDDLTIPIGRVGRLAKTLERIIEKAPSICLLRVSNPLGEFFGSGFRIGNDLVLTNEHVLFPLGIRATAVILDFLFEIDSNNQPLTVASFSGDLASIIADRGDDWAIIKVVGTMKSEWKTISLTDAPPPTPGDSAFIVQHPSGQMKRLGFVRNTISDLDDRVVHYLTDTQPGSSGSPVFDSEGRCIALHHAGGEPTQFIGRQPIIKNEGIRISRIHQALTARNLI